MIFSKWILNVMVSTYRLSCISFLFVYFQKDVYEASTKFLIDNVVTGYNATVFAYGATGNNLFHSDYVKTINTTGNNQHKY